MVVIKFPFTSMQQFNLDWVMQQLHKILQFMPMNGVAGDVLQRNVDGAVWMPLTSVSLDIHSMSTIPEVEGADELAIYDNSLQGNYKVTVQDLLDAAAPPVSSVNGQTGAVVLDAGDVGALPDTTAIPSDTSDLTNTAGFVDAAGAAAAAPVQSVSGKTGAVVLGKSDVGLGNVDNVQQYSASNPPPYPVTSVNGQTGDVVITPGGSFSPTLLWTNGNLLSSFSAQTVPLDLTDYSFIIIEYGVSEVGLILTAMFPVPTLPPPAGYSSYNCLQGWYITGSNGRMSQRSLQINTSGVVFSGGVRFDAYNNSNTSDDTRCLPYRIWGI